MARHFLRRLPFVGLSRADMDRRRRDMAARAIARRQGHTGVDGLRAEDFHPAPLARGERPGQGDVLSVRVGPL